MPKVNVKEADPVRYARVKAEQEKLWAQCSGSAMIARLCPYCEHKIEILCRGKHGGTFTKCPNCGEKIYFPPVSFRMA